MNNKDFWASIDKIVSDGFTSQGLQTLDYYAEQFISGGLVYKRFSPNEQHGCSAGGATHVIASILAGAEDSAKNAGTGECSTSKNGVTQQGCRPILGHLLSRTKGVTKRYTPYLFLFISPSY